MVAPLALPAVIALAVVRVPMLRDDARPSRGEATVLLLACAGWLALEPASLSSSGQRPSRVWRS